MRNETNWWRIVAIVAITLVLLEWFRMIGFGGGWCGSGNNYGLYGGMMSWMFGSGRVFMGFLMIVFWTLTILLIVWIIQRLQYREARRSK